jgi:hypothetical protein
VSFWGHAVLVLHKVGGSLVESGLKEFVEEHRFRRNIKMK